MSPLSTTAFLWRIERRDGVTLGFTSHDRALVRGGLSYRAAPGMAPSAVERSDGFEPGGLDVAGALSAGAIREEDLAAGRYDGARVTLVMADWQDEGVAVPLASGTLGAVEMQGGGFTAELRGPAALLEASPVEATSPSCRAELGDRRCRVDMAGRRRRATVTGVADEVVTLDRVLGDVFGWGRLRWLGGPLAGLSAAVRASAGAAVTLADAVEAAVPAGTAVELIEGCDKRFETCTGRFGNAVNFRGEPHLPGNDLLTRYPGA